MAFSNDPPNDYVFSNHTNLLKANGSAQEQKFMENLIVESIEIYGQDIYYLPRTYVNKDTIFQEVENSSFTQALAIRAYVNNVEGWEGQGELLSKFGVRIEDKTTFIFSREKFESKVDDNATLNVEGRPNEGDLIWFPITKHLFEIKFVEVERPFYQLGKGYVWEVQCELFEYSDEELDTGVTEIDAIETAFANAIKLVMDAGGSGAFTVGEEVVGNQFTATATATISGGDVTAVTISDGGEGYKSALPPTVTFSAPAAGGLSAIGSTYNTDFVLCSQSGTVTGSIGSGYSTGTYDLVGGSGSYGQLSLTSTGAVTGATANFNVVNPGIGYTNGDILQIDGGDGNAYIKLITVSSAITSTATGTATVDAAGLVTGITITDAGQNYRTAPTITINNSPKDVRAEVKSWDAATRSLQIINRTGTFSVDETVTGDTSGAKWSPASYNTLNNVNTEDSIDQNYSFETEDDDIIDFTEGNPFGSIGSTTDTTI